jgi:hypothetical protein
VNSLESGFGIKDEILTGLRYLKHFFHFVTSAKDVGFASPESGRNVLDGLAHENEQTGFRRRLQRILVDETFKVKLSTYGGPPLPGVSIPYASRTRKFSHARDAEQFPLRVLWPPAGDQAASGPHRVSPQTRSTQPAINRSTFPIVDT